jgi:hypothetical protein
VSEGEPGGEGALRLSAGGGGDRGVAVLALLAAVPDRPRTGFASRCFWNVGPISLWVRRGPHPRRSSDHPARGRPCPSARRSWICPASHTGLGRGMLPSSPSSTRVVGVLPLAGGSAEWLRRQHPAPWRPERSWRRSSSVASGSQGARGLVRRLGAQSCSHVGPGFEATPRAEARLQTMRTGTPSLGREPARRFVWAVVKTTINPRLSCSWGS